MKKISLLVLVSLIGVNAVAHNSPEMKTQKSLINKNVADAFELKNMTAMDLWDLGRVSAEGLTADGKTLLYGVSNYILDENKFEKNLFTVSLQGQAVKQFTTTIGAESVVKVEPNGDVVYSLNGQLWLQNINSDKAVQLTEVEGGLQNVKFSPDGRYILFTKKVLLKDYHSPNAFPDLPKSNMLIYDNLEYRHWDTFSEGMFDHLFVASYNKGEIGEPIDLLLNEPYYTPQAPFGGKEDFIWSPDSKSILYVCKKEFGTAYALSTNTDIYKYDLSTQETTNITEGMMGYDTNPSYSPNGEMLAWTSMKTAGYEADKSDIIISIPSTGQRLNLTEHWDGTVNSFIWSKDNKRIYFTAAVEGTVQLFQVQLPRDFNSRFLPVLSQVSKGHFDVTGIVGEIEEGLVVTSTTMTRATEVFLYSFKTKELRAITTVNDEKYAKLKNTKVEGRFTKASDGADLFSWVIYPPDFDPTKKYPTLLFCQGGPQSPTTLSYSFRWSFQLMASQGYIVLLPNRRGMPGWGVKWNEAISTDWGGQAIQDYLSAIDDFKKESYVDNDRIGAIGASYGGYSVFMLAGVHENRFKTFISHNGLFDMTSWYNTTEELFFANHDLGGPYWDTKNAKTYTAFNPIKHIDKWNTPILIYQGAKDYRVPVGQGLAAFQVAQLKGIKSRLVYMPDENHWVLSGQNALVWQHEFFKWLEETL